MVLEETPPLPSPDVQPPPIRRDCQAFATARPAGCKASSKVRKKKARSEELAIPCSLHQTATLSASLVGWPPPRRPLPCSNTKTDSQVWNKKKEPKHRGRLPWRSSHFGSLSQNVPSVILAGVWKQVHFTVPAIPESDIIKHYITIYLQVSWNRGTPKSSMLIGFSIINHPTMGYHHYGNPRIIRG